MKKWVIARPINGISINGDEYLFGENKNFFVYGSEEEATKALKDMFSESEAEEQGVYVKEIKVGDILFDSDGNKWKVFDVTDPENDVENHDVPMIHHAVLFQKKKLNVLANKEEENVDIEA